MVDTAWIGCNDDKIYITSGEFSSTLKDSQAIGDTIPTGITADETNMSWTGRNTDKLYLQSGQVTSTIKVSVSVNSIDNAPTGISWDGSDTAWCGTGGTKLYLTSGQVTATMKTSIAISSVSFVPEGISYDGTNTPIIADPSSDPEKMYLTSGQFSTTINDSENISSVDNVPTGVSWNGTNTPWCGVGGVKLYMQSGQFTSTIKTSQSTSAIDTAPADIDTMDTTSRLGGIVAGLQLAAETDTAFGMTIARGVDIGLATETSTAFAFTAVAIAPPTAPAGADSSFSDCENAGIAIINSALIKLGAARIDTLDDGSRNATICGDVYLDLLMEELRAHVWNFARKKQKLAQLSGTPVSRWDFQYVLPPDCLRVVNVNSDDAERSRSPYEIVARTIQSNEAELWLTYIALECDLGVMDPSFKELLSYRIAIEIAGAVTGLVSKRGERDKAGSLDHGYRRALLTARSTDAIESFPEQIPPTAWETRRHDGSGWGWNR